MNNETVIVITITAICVVYKKNGDLRKNLRIVSGTQQKLHFRENISDEPLNSVITVNNFFMTIK